MFLMQNGDNMPEITTIWGFLIRMLLAIALGAVIGTERQLTRHYTGIITTIIVCVGSFAFASFAFLVGDNNRDITRIAAQIVSGIGFLGAGVILSDGTKIKGINTAATVWASAAVGILCCIDKIWFAVAVAFAILITHLVLHPVTDYIEKKQKYDKTNKQNSQEAFYRISVTCSEDNAPEIKEKLIKKIKDTDDVLLRKLQMGDMTDGNVKVRAEISTKSKNNELVESIVAYLGTKKNIIAAGWKNSTHE